MTKTEILELVQRVNDYAMDHGLTLEEAVAQMDFPTQEDPTLYRVEHQCRNRCPKHHDNDGWYPKRSGLTQVEALAEGTRLIDKHPKSHYRIVKDI